MIGGTVTTLSGIFKILIHQEWADFNSYTAKQSTPSIN